VKMVFGLITVRSWNVSRSRSSMILVLVLSGSWNPTSRSQGEIWQGLCLGLKNQNLGLIPERLIYISGLRTFWSISSRWIVHSAVIFEGSTLMGPLDTSVHANCTNWKCCCVIVISVIKIHQLNKIALLVYCLSAAIVPLVVEAQLCQLSPVDAHTVAMKPCHVK